MWGWVGIRKGCIGEDKVSVFFLTGNRTTTIQFVAHLFAYCDCFMELLLIGSLTTLCLYGGYLVLSSMWGCLCNANWRDEAVTLPHLLSAHCVFILSCRRPSRQALLGFVVACFVTWWRSRAVYLHICCKHLCSVMHCELYQVTHFPWWTERCKSRVVFLCVCVTWSQSPFLTCLQTPSGNGG